MPPTQAALLDALGGTLEAWSFQCHAASVQLVKSGVCGPDARVARGSARGVPGQHSWVALGNPYDKATIVVDPTLPLYRSDVSEIYIGAPRKYGHTPHGAGSIWKAGKPTAGDGPIIELPGEFSQEAQRFLDMLGPLDRKGWHELAHSPVLGWPAAEIIDRMYDNRELAALIPIDVIGMLTRRLSSYLPDPA